MLSEKLKMIQRCFSVWKIIFEENGCVCDKSYEYVVLGIWNRREGSALENV